MTEQNVSTTDTTDWVASLAKLNLPEFIAGPAGKAISRLIGSAADVPAAWLERHVELVRAETKARKLVIGAAGNAGAKSVADNEYIASDVLRSWLPSELRKMYNKRQVVAETLIALEDPRNESLDSETSHDVDDDWLNVFQRFAEDASSERLKQTYARILAGEIRKPGAFSLQTLRILSEIDQKTAEKFQTFCSRAIAVAVDGRTLIGNMHPAGHLEEDAVLLADSGLISGSDSGLSHNLEFEKEMAVIYIPFQKFQGVKLIEIQFEKLERSFSMPIYMMTKVGSELFKIIEIQNENKIVFDAFIRGSGTVGGTKCKSIKIGYNCLASSGSFKFLEEQIIHGQ